ncbi:MAG: S8 family peptidase, partial [Bacteroidota bacterium]|nr:S8 family peptidase [Bacteroidota bacterium]
LMKPDISAPGQDICSSFNSYAIENVTGVTQLSFNNRTYKFIRLSGTSMSAPMITGAIALLLEANPDLSPAEVKSILQEYALRDALTGAIPPEGSPRWGHGKLDIYNAILSLTETAVSDPHNVSASLLYPNPAQDQVFVKKELLGNETYTLSQLDGKLISHGHFDGSINVANHPDGLYILTIENSSSRESFMVIVKH